MTRAQTADGRIETALCEEGERRQDAPVDDSRSDVRTAALVDLDPWIVQDTVLERFLAHQQDLACVAGGAALDAEQRGRLQKLPARKDRGRVDAARATGTDLEA